MLCRFAQKHQKTFVFNLCGEYVCEDINYVQNVLAILPFVDILFGNLSEFEVFIDTIEAKLETSSAVIRNLRAMVRSEGVENLDMKIENICESPVRNVGDIIGVLPALGEEQAEEPDSGGDGGLRAGPVLQHWGPPEDGLGACAKASWQRCQGKQNWLKKNREMARNYSWFELFYWLLISKTLYPLKRCIWYWDSMLRSI